MGAGICYETQVGVEVYTGGFIERTNRLLFHYGEHYPESGKYDEDPKLNIGPKHICVVAKPGGDDKVVAESEKVCAPFPSGALVAFPHAQTVGEDALIMMKKKKNKQTHWNFEPEPAEEYGCLIDPFIFKRRNADTYALVQCWGNKFNDEYTSTRKVYTFEQGNPNPAVFEPQAVDDFCVSMERLFGDPNRNEASDETKKYMKYTVAETDNDSNVYVGVSEKLIEYLRENPDVVEMLGIEIKGPLSFTSTITYPKKPDKANSSMEFEMLPGVKYALYLKKGWETLATPTPLDLFLKERELK